MTVAGVHPGVIETLSAALGADAVLPAGVLTLNTAVKAGVIAPGVRTIHIAGVAATVFVIATLVVTEVTAHYTGAVEPVYIMRTFFAAYGAQTAFVVVVLTVQTAVVAQIAVYPFVLTGGAAMNASSVIVVVVALRAADLTDIAVPFAVLTAQIAVLAEAVAPAVLTRRATFLTYAVVVVGVCARTAALTASDILGAVRDGDIVAEFTERGVFANSDITLIGNNYPVAVADALLVIAKAESVAEVGIEVE